MQITDVRVFPVRDDKLKAFVSVVFESCFMVNDIKVINGRDGYFISMPSRRKKNGDFKDVAHPLNTETRRLLEERILDEYEQVVAVDEPPARRYERAESGAGPEKSTGESGGESQSRSEPQGESRVAPASADAKRPEGEPEQGAAPASAESTSEEQESKDQASPSTAPADSSGRERRDLDDVVEDHLSDSFWS